ncbi:MAG: adenylate/guanylate cyclase domain-containing protein [Candidatus Marinimicrobia bacterium]|jgi:adenylate cyclase|nr:adenylate/guanylate cyclase domain-containing protein [Candidatus Neomarinimicrobiota bacterium]MBT4362123.1 adenylate/guanylate cyclase domain-containing protein [Candidatus Neomarinimicrobiota bacterium]MBT4713646.1 adenylate/guanylate cyclase domain-containing protein [Candidatus Neomarinimicrobiota bacterium]MBT4945330.1 adenylate/guanylate cyclase domain-containing protein [Candidatus Neomarinimicrobiota bacterium]MBT5269599.1 adenylate/guanylate cyclase domain-containing protein [Candi
MLKKHGIGVLFTFIAIVLALLVQVIGLFDLANYKMLDYSYQLRGPLSSWAAHQDNPNDSLDVILIDVDDETFRLLADYGWPYPRGKIWDAAIINLANAGAKVIVFDIQFDSRDAHTARVLSVFNGILPEGYSDGDVEVAEAIKYARSRGTEVVMASTIKTELSSVPPQMLVTPNEYIMQVDPDHGLVDIEEDKDHFTRRYPVFGAMNHSPDEWRLSLAMKAVKHFLEIPSEPGLTYNYEVGEFTYGPLTIPTYGSDHPGFLTNIYGPASHARIGESEPWQTFQRFPLVWIIDTEDFDLPVADEDTDWMSNFDPTSGFNSMMTLMDPTYEVMDSPFKDKICIIGVSVEVMHDYKSTAFFDYLGAPTLMPGFEYHANATQTLLDENFVHVLGKTIEFTSDSALSHILLIFVCALIAYLIIAFLDPLWGAVLIGLEAIVLFSISVGMFTTDHLWFFKWISGKSESILIPPPGETLFVPIIAPLVVMALTYLTNVLYKFILEQRDKHFLKDTFGTYIAPELIDKMYEEKQEPKLGGDAGVHTAFFTDIQSFSAFSEKLSAEEVVELLNEYLTDMTDILLANQGTLDKYIGDAIVAFYGAPVPVENHEYMACLTAIEMQDGLDELRKKWQGEGDRWPDIVHHMQNRIGIATGDMVTGNMGSAMRMNYTMMGDVVNTAARFEASAKQYGVYIQVLESTYEACKDDFHWRELDYVTVKGKSVPAYSYELIARKGKLSPTYEKLLPVYNKGLKLYRSQKWVEAKKTFIEADALEDMFPFRPTNPSKVYIERCEYFMENPPGEDWDGSWTLTSK